MARKRITEIKEVDKSTILYGGIGRDDSGDTMLVLISVLFILWSLF